MACSKCGAEKQLRRGLCKRCWATNRLRDGWESSYVPAQPTRGHVNMLIAAGLGTRRISELSGVNRKAITQLLHGRPDRGTPPSERVLASTAARIQAVPIPTALHELSAAHKPVLAVGTTRRLQALVCIGYTQSYLAGRLGMDPTNITDLMHGKRPCVLAVRARMVVVLYEELSMMPPSDLQAWTLRSRARARRLGWVDPFGWDDDDIDDPDAVGIPAPKERSHGRAEQYRELRELGYTDGEIARRFGIDEASLARWMLRERGNENGIEHAG